MDKDERQANGAEENDKNIDLSMQVIAPNCDENQDRAAIQVTPL